MSAPVRVAVLSFVTLTAAVAAGAQPPDPPFPEPPGTQLAQNLKRFRRIARLPHPVVPAYAEFDARIGWRATPSWDISLIGQNLLHARHPEFLLASPTREEFQRGAYDRVLWQD